MAELVVEVKKVINAPIEKVFKAWVEPEQMKRWYSPEGMATPAASTDGKVGGKYAVTMQMGEQKFEMFGKYLEYDKPNPSTGSGQAKLVFTWNDDSSVVAVDFKKLDDNKTEVSLRHTGFTDEQSRAQHDEGWIGTLNKLAKHFG